MEETECFQLQALVQINFKAILKCLADAHGPCVTAISLCSVQTKIEVILSAQLEPQPGPNVGKKMFIPELISTRYQAAETSKSNQAKSFRKL